MNATATKPGWPEALPDHLSASQVNTFERCPEAYRRRYLLHEREALGPSMLMGRADHDAYEHFFRERMRGVTPSLAEVQERYAASIAENLDEADEKGERVVWDDDDVTGQAKAVDKGVPLLGAYYPVAVSVATPIAVEANFEYTTPRLPVVIRGRIDVETEPVVIERKRAAARKKKLDGKWILQNMIYRVEKEKPVETHISVRTKTPYAITSADEPGLLSAFHPSLVGLTERYVGRIARTMHAFYVMYGADQPWPGSLAHDWACSYCSYRPSCAWWEGQEAAA